MERKRTMRSVILNTETRNCGSSQKAEEMALKSLLDRMLKVIHKGSRVNVFGDTLSIIKAFPKGKYSTHFKNLCNRYNMELAHIPRKQNKLAHDLTQGKRIS